MTFHASMVNMKSLTRKSRFLTQFRIKIGPIIPKPFTNNLDSLERAYVANVAAVSIASIDDSA